MSDEFGTNDYPADGTDEHRADDRATGHGGAPATGEGAHPDAFGAGDGVWYPLPTGGEFDGEATMHVSFAGQLPDVVALRAGADPLAAPGHGYVPQEHHPQAAAAPQPQETTGQWAVPIEAVAVEPGQGPASVPPVPAPTVDPGATQQWSIPFVADDPAEESGEYSLGALIDRGQGAPQPPYAPEQPHPYASEPDALAQPPYEPVTHEPVTHEPVTHEPAIHEPPGYEPPRHGQGGYDPVDPAAGDPAFVGEHAPAPVEHAPVPAEDIPEPHAFQPPEHPGAPEDAGVPGFPERAAAPDAPVAEGDPHTEHPLASYVLRVNGADRPVTDAWLGESLLYVLRERLGLAGAKDGCEQGECGACSVQVDGRLVASCLMPAATAAGCEVRTVEGLAQAGRPSDVQRALAECGAVQCGFCVPGMAMTVHDLLAGNHRPTELETRQALCGNLCRCSGYQGVLDAVRQVVAEREATAEAGEEGEPAQDGLPRIPHQATGEQSQGGGAPA
ncbi:2Fe-2S iron-sulfur cluster-binding protein [Streptantibioticus parmotrematis]|nr:2Fe-2S iron-sulfur cluster-binding protein [Streptantibioticus parmotrematis]